MCITHSTRLNSNPERVLMSKPRSKPTPIPLRLRWWAISALIVGLTGALAIHFILTRVNFSIPAEILLYGLIFITVAALVVPVSAYVNHRFGRPGWRKRDPRRLLRQGGEVGLVTLAMTYLQRYQSLDLVIALALIGVFFLVELYLITRT